MTIAQIFSRGDRPIDVICVGRVAVDLYAEQIGSPLSQAQSFRKYLGGCAGNIAVGTARLGLKSAMCSRVGSDAMGVFLRAQLTREGVDTQMLVSDDKHLTGLVLLGVSPPDDFPLIFYRNDCADEELKAEDLPAALMRQSKCVVVTGTGLCKAKTRETTLRIIELAQKCETPVVLDIDYRPVLWGLTNPGEGALRYEKSAAVTKIFQSVLRQVDLIVGTEEEFMIASGQDAIADAIAKLRRELRAILVVKKGEQGCEVWLPEFVQPIRAAPFKVDVLNVLGAGDAFLSGFLRGLLRGESWETCGRYANACGALVVSRHGCSPAMPSIAELTHFMQPSEKITAQIDKLHRKAHMGAHSTRDMLVLAFDHRTQFEETCKEGELALIAEFKAQVYVGFCKARAQIDVFGEAAILVDPIYGQNVLRVAANTLVGVPIERASASNEELSWIGEASAYQEILARPSHHFVKVLVRYHPDMPQQIAEHQLSKLRELGHACDALERKLMLELLMPKGISENGEAHAQAMRSIYEAGVAPWWWKIQAMASREDWLKVCGVIDAYDGDARVVILGKGASVNELCEGFKIAQSTHHAAGFAVGRTIFWPSYKRVMAGEIAMSDVAGDIAARFVEVAKVWHESGERHA